MRSLFYFARLMAMQFMESLNYTLHLDEYKCTLHSFHAYKNRSCENVIIFKFKYYTNCK